MSEPMISPMRLLLQQCFVPILVADGVDALLEVEAIVAAGLRVLEFTLRRPDAREMIPEIRRRHPDVILLVGSVVDSPALVARLRGRHPQLQTVDELMAAGVDGLVSMFDFRQETYERHASSKLLIPAVSTMAEGLRQAELGAHALKILGSFPATLGALGSAPAFQLSPLFVTGGMTPETMPEAARRGAALFAAGFDVLARGLESPLTVQGLSERIRLFQAGALAARREKYPDLDAILQSDDWACRVPWPVKDFARS